MKPNIESQPGRADGGVVVGIEAHIIVVEVGE